MTQPKFDPNSPTCAVQNCELPKRPGRYLCDMHATQVDNFDPEAARAAIEKAQRRADRWARSSAALEQAQRRSGDAEKICPHCQVKGRITSRRVKQKKGISGGKATGAVLTGGVSLFATGLSRKERGTEMWCHNCNTRWVV